MNIWATIILWDEADLSPKRIVRENAHERLTIAFVSNVDEASVVALELIDQGAELIELCGGFGLEAGAVVSHAVAGRAAIGTVTFGIESISQAAAYKTRFQMGD